MKKKSLLILLISLFSLDSNAMNPPLRRYTSSNLIVNNQSNQPCTVCYHQPGRPGFEGAHRLIKKSKTLKPGETKFLRVLKQNNAQLVIYDDSYEVASNEESHHFCK